MPPRTLGPSRGIPGAVDVELEDGSVIAVAAEYAPPQEPPVGTGPHLAQRLPSQGDFRQGFAPPPPQGLPAGAFAQTRGVPSTPEFEDVYADDAPAVPAQPAPFAVPFGDPLNSAQATETMAQGMLYGQQGPNAAAQRRPLTGPREGFPGVTGPGGPAPVFARPRQQPGPATGGSAPPDMTGPAADLDTARRAYALALSPRGGGGPVERTDATIVEQRGGPVSPETQARLAAATQAADAATRTAFQTQAAGLASLAGEERRTQQGIDDAAARARAREEQIQAEAAGRMARLDDERSRVASFDPATSRYWGRPDTPSHIGAAVGVFLGGWAAGPDGQNRALQTIQHAISRDVDVQRAALDARLRGVDQGLSALQVARGIYSDQRAAEAATVALMLEGAQARVRAGLAQAQSDDVLANGKALLAQLEQQRAAAQAAAEAAQVQATRRTRILPGGSGLPSRDVALRAAAGLTALSREAREQASVEGQGPGISAEQDRALQRADRGVPPVGTQVIPGQEGQWRSTTPEGRDRALTLYASYQSVDAALARLEQIRQEHGSETMNRAVVGQVEGIIGTILPQINDLQNGGVLQQGDISRLTALISDPRAHTMTSSRFFGQIGAIRTGFRTSTNAQLRARLGLRLAPTTREARSSVRRGE